MTNEYMTLCAMMKIYCRGHHISSSTADLCQECRELRDYAGQRLLHCPFQHDKPTCGNCLVHCYKKSMRDKIKTVMRYSGPRMVYRHPIMAFRHLLDGRRRRAQKMQTK